MPASLVYGFASMVILLTAVIHLLLPVAVKNKAIYMLLAFLLSLSLLLMQVNEVPVFYYLRGYIGDLSITATLFFSTSIIQGVWGKAIYQPVEKKYLMLLVILGGLFLYPMALGVSQFDPYRLGYQPQILLSVLFLAGLYFWYKQYYFLVFVLTSAGLCFSLGLLESNNLWDYLLDPMLLLVFLTMALLSALRAGINQVWE